MYPFIEIFSFKIPTYALAFSVAFIICMIVMYRSAPKLGLRSDDSLYASIYGIIGLVLFAKLFFFFTKVTKLPAYFRFISAGNKFNIYHFCNYFFGGMVFYGGLIGYVLGVFIYSRQYKTPFIKYFDSYVPFMPLVHAFGRVGCFLAGCCYGIEYTGPLAVNYPYNEIVPELSEVSRFPVQLLEAFINSLCFILLLSLRNKRKLKSGQLPGIYILFYLIERTLLEFLRGDTARGSVGILSTSQFISLLLIPIALILISGKLSARFDSINKGLEKKG